ncbi:hypothetical protein BH11PSE14_BH11PSE14_11270 [soil metagenome]
MISGIVTAILLAAFIGGTAWAYSSKRRAEFEVAARMPLDDLPLPAETEVALAISNQEHRS